MRLQLPFIHIRFFYLIAVGLLLFLAPPLQATHIRAGDITAKSDTSLPVRNPLRYFFTLTLYTDISPGVIADQPDATLFFGDGTSQRVNRSVFLPVGNNTAKNVFYFDHIYSSPSPNYTVFFNGENRNSGILNMTSSNQQSFFISTRITIDPLIGINRSPVLRRAPIDIGAIGQIFVHNPDAFDPDGDSLSFKMRVPQSSPPGQNPPVGQNVPGYRSPGDPFFGGSQVPNPPGGPVLFTLNEQTGQLTWNSPNLQGEYNIAFVVEEWRGRRKLGEVVRDMQILIRATGNRRPVLSIPQDICVVAGTPLQEFISASDPDITNPNPPTGQLTITASSGIIPPATFAMTSGRQGVFNWTPACTDVRTQPYQVVFKVEDNPNAPDPKLVDIQTWRITVVGPAPQNLTVTPQNRNMQLNWNLYTCQNASKIFIYRKEGPSGFVPALCETGVPASTGYQKIAEVNPNVTSYLDTNNGNGLKRGVTFCYIIYAEFPEPAGGKSYASQEVCANLEPNAPVMLNVSVTETATATGKMFVRWSMPRNLTQLTPPVGYKLFRAENSTGPANYTEIYNTIVATDTSFTDTDINTAERSYRYRIEFYENATGALPRLLETTDAASSVRLTGAPASTSISLTWNYEVPWDNSRRRHFIYRQINGNFVLIDSVNAGLTNGTYTDRGTFGNEPLRPRQQYCYFVTTSGTYNNAGLPEPLLNNSQRFCITPRDTAAPCPLVLAIDPVDCDNFIPNPPYQNVLTWEPGTGEGCDTDIKYYTIYFNPRVDYIPQDESPFDSIGTTTGLTFTHGNLNSLAGCYVVTATDSSGNESKFSNQVCKENCIFFELPNIITPNGDNKNDVLRPDRRSAFVQDVTFKVYNRWGDLLIEIKGDPDINWRGVNQYGELLPDGIYYYKADVKFFSLDPKLATQTYKGWVEIVR